MTLQGLRSNINAVKESEITGVVKISDLLEDNDMTELKAGTYDGFIEWSLPEGIKAKSPVSVYVIVEEK